VRFSPTGERIVRSDVLVYVQAARDLIEGRDLYAPAPGRDPYVYPPFYALLHVPVIAFDPLAIDVAWYLLNVFFLCAALHLGFSLFTGARFIDLPVRRQWLYAGLPLAFAARYLARNAQQGNVNVAVLFAIVLAFYMRERTGRASWAGLVGLAAAIKVLPLVFFVYYLGRRRWRDLGFACGAFLVASLLPAAVVGIETYGAYLQSFADYLQRRMAPAGVAVENFSFWGLFGRLLSPQVAFTLADGSPVYVNVAGLELRSVAALVHAVQVVLLGIVYTVARRTEPRAEPRNGALVVALLTMNLASALIEEHHAVTFLVAFLYLLVAWRTRAAAAPLFVAALLAAGILSNLVTYDAIVPLFGKRAYMTLLAYSIPVLPVGVLLLALVLHRPMCGGRARESRVPAS
jgi:hypothetical protein